MQYSVMVVTFISFPQVTYFQGVCVCVSVGLWQANFFLALLFTQFQYVWSFYTLNTCGWARQSDDLCGVQYRSPSTCHHGTHPKSVQQFVTQMDSHEIKSYDPMR